MKKEDKKEIQERRAEGKSVLCGVVAHNLKKTIMKNAKETESDIAEACAIFHKRHEQKTGRPIKTIREFEQVTRDLSKLPKEEIEKLINESKDEKTINRSGGK
jgi:hypothetical protein